ncbi:hypothetical protein AB0383_48460 [Amycolatopsis sp. NPDC051373]|uniref:hypothetical protein n=1 Tax=Amycolatopsis sp. NPDC051373 TaxID=3155801 RepID=UPI0034502891
MRISKSNVPKLVRLQEEYDAQLRRAINEDGTRNRDVLLCIAELAGQMARIHSEEAQGMRRVANDAYDLAITK